MIIINCIKIDSSNDFSVTDNGSVGNALKQVKKAKHSLFRYCPLNQHFALPCLILLTLGTPVSNMISYFGMLMDPNVFVGG